MFKRINNWHLLFLIGVVSIISVVLSQQYVFAQWEDPVALPGETDGFRLVIMTLVMNLY